MKRSVLLIVLCLAVSMVFGDKTSTEAGGDWHNAATWIEGGVPSSTDNVIINGPVTVGGGTCANLTINPAGSLLNRAYQNNSVSVFGSISNLGRFGNESTGYLTVNSNGAIDNNGIFNPRFLSLYGGLTQALSGGSVFSPEFLTDYNSSSSVTLASDVGFGNTTIDLQGAQLLLNGNDLNVSGGKLYRAVVQCGTISSLTMGNSAYLESVQFYGNLDLYGEVQVYVNVSTINVNLLNNYALLTNRTGYSTTLNLTGSLQTLNNFGTIQNSPGGGNLTVSFSGQYLNHHGVLSNYRFEWVRTGTCYIFQDEEAEPILCGSFVSTASSATYQMLSDLSFTNCSIDLNNKTVLMNSGADDFNANVLNTTPGQLPLLQRVVFSGSLASVLTISNATLQSFTCNASAVTQGTIAISSGNSFAYLTNNGTLRNSSSAGNSLTINNDLTNNGTITNYNSSLMLTLTLKGSLQNNGTLNNQTLYLNNSSMVNLAHVSAVPIGCLYFTSNGTGSYQLISSLVFNDTFVDFNGKDVCMYDANGDYGITLNGSGRFVQNLVIYGGPDSYLTLGSGTYLSNLTADHLTFNGNVNIKENTTQVDYLTNNAVLMNHSASSYQIRINQLLVNNGTIQNYSSSLGLALVMYGSFHNNGTITNNTVNFYNSETRDLWQSETSLPLSCSYLLANTGSVGLRMLSNLRFSGCYISLNNVTLQMHNAGMAYGIRMIDHGYLRLANLDAIEGSFLDLDSGVYLQNLNIARIELRGTVRMNTSVVAQYLVNQGTLRNYGALETLTVTHTLENYGIITTSSSGSFTLALEGDLLNYGQISNSAIQISGPFTHHIFNAAIAPPISCDSFTVDPASGELQLLSDLAFQSCSIHLGGRITRMYDGRAIYNLSLENSLLTGAVLATQGFSHLALNNNSGLNYVTAQDIILSGTAHIVNSVTFENLTVASGCTVQTSVNTASLYCNGDLINNGSIQDNPSGADLYLACRGNLFNYGSLLNHRVYVTNDALQDQYLLLNGIVSNPGGLVLESNIGTADWYKSGVLQYEGYTQITVDPTVYCVWKPVSTLGEGRRITISGGSPVSTPVGVVILPDPVVPFLRWNQVPNALYYNVYVSEDPEAEFELLYGFIFDHAPDDGWVYLGIQMNEQMKFFKVTAQN